MRSISLFFLAATISFTAWSQAGSTNTMPVHTTSPEALSTFHKGLALYDLGDDRNAEKFFTKVVEQDPDLVNGYLFLAACSRTSKDFAERLKKAKAHLSSADEWEKLHFSLLETNLTDDLNQRLAIARKIVSTYPKVARAYVHLGTVYLERKEVTQARESLQKAITLAPDWAGGYVIFAISYLFYEPRDFAQAEKHARKEAELAPRHPNSHILLGDCYRAQNKMEKARDAYSKAITLDATMPGPYYKRGHAHTFLGNYDQARLDYEQAGKKDELPAYASQFMANTFLYQNDKDKAVKLLQEATDKSKLPKDAARMATVKNDIFYLLAHIALHYQDAASLQALLPEWEQVSEQLASDVGTEEAKLNNASEILFWKSVVPALQGDFPQAMARAEEMKKTLAPINNPLKLESYYRLLGLINAKQNNFEQAVKHFEMADKNNVYNRYCLAKAYESAGQKDKAMQLYKEIADYNFNDIGYALVRNEVKKKVVQP